MMTVIQIKTPLRIPLPPPNQPVDWEEAEETNNRAMVENYQPPKLEKSMIIENEEPSKPNHIPKPKPANHMHQSHQSLSTSKQSSMYKLKKKEQFKSTLFPGYLPNGEKKKMTDEEKGIIDKLMNECEEEEKRVITSESYKKMLMDRKKNSTHFKITGLHHAEKPKYNSLEDRNMVEYFHNDYVQSFLLKNKVVG